MAIISKNKLEAAKRLLFISPLALGDFLYIKTFLIAFQRQNPHIEVDIWLDDCRNNSDQWRLSRSKIMQQWIEAEPAFSRSYPCCASKEQQQEQINVANALEYDLIITHSGSKSEQFSNIARLIAPNAFIVSSIGKSKFAGVLNFWLFRGSDATFNLNSNKFNSNHHITDRYYQLLKQITGISLDKSEFMPNLIIPEDIKSITRTWIGDKFNDESRQGELIFINHLSTNTKRDWKEEQLFDLIEKIGKQSPDSRFVINVTGEHFDAMQEKVTNNSCLNKLQTAVFTVDKHFFELPSLIAASNIIITVETAIMHFATASNRPLIAMMRQKKPYWAPPITNKSKVLYATSGKGYVSNIAVDEVLETYLKVSK